MEKALDILHEADYTDPTAFTAESMDTLTNGLGLSFGTARLITLRARLWKSHVKAESRRHLDLH